MVPSSGTCTPKIRLQRVDLPAPFSPRMQCTSPGMMSSETSDTATNEPNRLVTPCSANSGSVIVGVGSFTASDRDKSGVALALQHLDLAGEDILLYLVKFGFLFWRGAANDHVGC